MDANFLLIVMMVVVLTSIVGFTVNGVVKKVLDYKRDKDAMLAKPSTGQITNVVQRTDHIEERLKVLERIATDPEARRGANLAQEIEDLRIDQAQKELS